MFRSLATISALAFAMSAIPAAATIVIFDTPGAVQPDENVQFQGAPPSGLNAFGVTNQTDTDVTFTGTEALATPAMGQARVEAADGGLGFLSFELADADLGFKEVEFNIFGTGASATSVVLSFTDQFGEVFTQTSAIGNGQNFFSAQALDDQFITLVSLSLNGNVDDVRQVRIGGIGAFGDDGSGSTVPEPQSWALLVAGFGSVGFAMRRRKRLVSVTA